MFDDTDTLVQVLRRELDDAEIRQTLVIFEVGSSAFKIIQEFELQRSRSDGKLTLVKSSVSCTHESLFTTMDSAIEAATKLVDKYFIEGWQVCRSDSTDCEELDNQSDGKLERD
jgi:hypothetical protein